MSEITVKCPECTNDVHLDTNILKKTDGHAVCSHCQHTFKLVRKSKTAPEVLDKATGKQKTSKKQPANRKVAPKLVKTVAAMSALNRTQKPLSYREPRAKPHFGEVGSEPFMFNLMDRDSVNAQLPQISVKPSTGNGSLGMPAMKNDSQQNNITIHTDSLVFTLVGDGGSTSLPSTQMSMGNLPSTVLNPASAAPVVVQQPTNDTNWTVATIAAMAVLVMQLFYWILLGA